MLTALTRVLFKQTKNPPKRVVPIDKNPLARWSRQLPRWTQLPACLPNSHVGLEGCNSAFNATNSIRTCLFFGTTTPPCFLSVKRWSDIEHVQTRPEDVPAEFNDVAASDANAAARHFCGAEMKDLALFGEDAFLLPSSQVESPAAERPPLVAVENFTSRSESIFRRRFPSEGWRMVVGHENWGVRPEFLYGVAQRDDHRPRVSTSVPITPSELTAQCVLYVPQYGTISSLNVVTSLGIALFYAFLDHYFPKSRTLVSEQLDAAAQDTPCATLTVADLLRYQQQFTLALPAPADTLSGGTVSSSEATSSASLEGSEQHRNTSPRVDSRPIHPLYYHGHKESIRDRHREHRDALLAFSQAATGASRTEFGLSVLYENEFDQRNFGGLIRNANGFLVDHIFYVGRRKFNVVGAVGSNHYTPPEYLGPSYDADEEGQSTSDVVAWSDALRQRVDQMCRNTPLRWWLLDIGHQHLYEDVDTATHAAETVSASRRSSGGNDYGSRYSSTESLEWYRDRMEDPSSTLCLCDSEDSLATASREGVLLIVPQEGKLPHISLLRHCEKILTIIPSFHCASPAGLPSQVASGIALQRLSVIMHPQIRLLS